MNAGIYIHIPFCRARCSYCDFATGMFDSDVADRYVRAIVAEISRWSEVGLPAAIDTIYFGGGTPSLLTVEQLQNILNAVRGRFDVAGNSEITLEINPGDGGTSIRGARPSLAAKRAQHAQTVFALRAHAGRNAGAPFFRDLRRLGINRASFGAQTFEERELKMLGRTHHSAGIHETFEQLRDAGFDNINFDLIAGLPGQTLAGWKRNLDKALQLRPDHLSLYLLDVHEGTPLHDQIKRGMRPKPDEDLAAEMYAFMVERVGAAGYEHYEISNFCLPGFESRHNTKYWSGAPYYGFGNSAHSYDGARRRWANERDAAKFLALVDRSDSLIVERSELTEQDVRSEAIFLGLRLMRGIDLNSYRVRFGTDLREQFNGELDRLEAAGLIEIEETRLKLTARGALLSNEVFAALG